MFEYMSQAWSWLSINAAILIALCALFFTMYQTLATRKHNRLSVKPHLCFFTHKEFNDNETILKSTLHNNGLGPALIKSFQFYLDEKEIEVKNSDDFDPYIKKILEKLEYKHSFTNLGKDYAMKAGEERDILVIKTPVTDKNEINEYLKPIERFDLKITFESMYGEKDEYDSIKKKLEGKLT